MKKWMKIFLGVLSAILVIVLAVCVWQWANINVLIKTFLSTSDEIAQEMNDTKMQLEEELRQHSTSIISDFTAEEEKKIIKGEMTVDEAVAILNERYESKKNNSSSVNTSNPDAERLIAQKTVELYSLKAYYLGQLGQMEAVVKSDYAALPKDQKNLLGKKEIVSKHMGTALGLLNQCDARVDEILNELKYGLEKLNVDTSIIKTIRTAYENEKNLKKAYYLKLMEE